jgi:hypothetical protein
MLDGSRRFACAENRELSVIALILASYRSTLGGRRSGVLDSGSAIAWTPLWWVSAAGRFRDSCDGKDERDGAALRSHAHGKRLGLLRVCPGWIGSGWLCWGEENASLFQRSSSPAGVADFEPKESPPSAASGAIGAVLGFA